MRIRLTPLNIVTAILIASVGYLLINRDDSGWRILGSIPLIVLAVLSFISDMLFRRFFPSLKRIWIIELGFIIFVGALIMLIQFLK